ncbi:Protocatechuate 3,4-dioxygenase alpha chain [Rhodobacteraceae bacterium THAF1]|uniref:protocatechuate 3,4-dioxygenase subunit alpha n=1 Tax=Palleronia sp. THAF1 TaxID=2587842 RepID=UPI000F3B85EC|nr:protocatechuate 3,4-dioxygenase subunit alpha [Palleronia sp. THAF1]QFU09697.1 Protocatechuate 3,4-dioxygenase alpha chain [Palleronia sp. THAF1]VDC17400.1 Protocatechuate 3,4-dioxygenase alpha chain [Rhodobacteraceae bacterium THAF1]
MPLEYPKESPSQTAGPFVHIGTVPSLAGLSLHPIAFGQTIAGPDVVGDRIVIEGHVYDGMGAPVRDMLIEVWQADPNGIYPHPADTRHAEVDSGFTGFGRVATDFDTGSFRIETVKPGSVPGRHDRPQAPHLSLWMVARGINVGLQTRLYFGDEAEANAADPLLALIDPATRRDTLIARAEGDGRYTFDIRLQGPKETVFLDV